jgi:hypothetical protein
VCTHVPTWQGQTAIKYQRIWQRSADGFDLATEVVGLVNDLVGALLSQLSSNCSTTSGSFLELLIAKRLLVERTHDHYLCSAVCLPHAVWPRNAHLDVCLFVWSRYECNRLMSAFDANGSHVWPCKLIHPCCILTQALVLYWVPYAGARLWCGAAEYQTLDDDPDNNVVDNSPPVRRSCQCSLWTVAFTLSCIAAML